MFEELVLFEKGTRHAHLESIGTAMNSIDRVRKSIETIISGSSVPEDPVHSKNTLQWLLKLKPDADEALQIAALGHDIERAIDERKVRREDFEYYNQFKATHAHNSAQILKEVMLNCGVEDISTLGSKTTVGIVPLASHLPANPGQYPRPSPLLHA